MNDMTKRILVVEDDEQISNFICYALSNEGFDYDAASSIAEARKILAENQTEILILDLGLPDGDGKTIITEVREKSQMPIIVVSARDRENEKVMALDSGADDYLTKPFSATELLARIRVSCRHLNMMGVHEKQKEYTVKELKVDTDRHIVYLQGEELHVTPMEFKLLVCLFENIGKVVTTGTIIETLWGAGYGNDTQALRAIMAGLRRKIEKNPGKPEYITTEIGVGYRLLDEE